MTWFTSDLHFGHMSIIHMNDRPFSNVKEMNEILIENYNNCVKPNDDVYFLGDLTLHLDRIDSIKLVSRLNGKKHLLWGNHDKDYYGDIFKTYDQLLEISALNHRFVLCHYPLMTWMHMGRGYINLHGHSHNKPSYNEEMREHRILRYDVGVDANGYMPVSARQIIKFFGKEIIDKPNVNHHKDWEN